AWMGFDPLTFSAGSPVKRRVPARPCRCIAALVASSAARLDMPRPECGSVWPPACSLRPGRGRLTVAASWQLPGTASYSAYMPTVGPAPFTPPLVQWAQKAVGMPPDPSSTEKPSRFRRSTYQAADWYSRQAVSPKSKMVRVQADSSGPDRSTKASAVVSAGVIANFLFRAKESSERSDQ